MERESFEDKEVAEVLNRHFVAIKVDREERPDIDHIYMSVCQALTGRGGWPLTVFLTPDKKPFYAGTYFPKQDRMGLPGLITMLERINTAWNNTRENLLESSEKITEYIQDSRQISKTDLPGDLAERAFNEFEDDFDREYGGFGKAPKFPAAHNLFFLMRYWYITKNSKALDMVKKTLDTMRKGGIYDHVGYGFSRYSTDREWLVPHFEKMLYDNALLSIAYIEAYLVTKKEVYAQTAREIFTYVLRDMTSPEGAFYSAEDADSEGVEGKFYIWTKEEVLKILGEDSGNKFCMLFDITNRGNFEGKNIPNLIGHTVPAELKEFAEDCRKKLYKYREQRIHPYKDDKILTSWNGLMIAAMAYGARALGDSGLTQAAEKACDFILTRLVREDGRLLARYRDGEAALPAYSDDYAFMVWGLLELYEATFRPHWLKKAVELNDELIRLFHDEKEGGLFLYGSDSEKLLTRPKDAYDGAIPSANSVSAHNFIRLARLTGRHELEEKSRNIIKIFGENLTEVPRGYSYMLTAYLYMKFKGSEVVIVDDKESDDSRLMISAVHNNFNPFTILMFFASDSPELKSIAPFLENYKVVDSKATAYVCEGFSCRPPVTDPESLINALVH